MPRLMDAFKAKLTRRIPALDVPDLEVRNTISRDRNMPDFFEYDVRVEFGCKITCRYGAIEYAIELAVERFREAAYGDIRKKMLELRMLIHTGRGGSCRAMELVDQICEEVVG